MYIAVNNNHRRKFYFPNKRTKRKQATPRITTSELSEYQIICPSILKLSENSRIS